MRIWGLERVRRAARWVRNRFVDSALILLYHRVTELPSDPQVLGVTPQNFTEHLEILRRLCRPMRLQQLAQALQDGNLPHQAVVITFDDGYADNLHNAKPLLERWDIPATVFVTTGHIGQEREFWWDELARLLLQPETLPEMLRLSVNRSTWQWELGEVDHYGKDAHRGNRCGDAPEKHGHSPRHRLYRALHQLLRPLPTGERWKVLDELQAWAGVKPTVRPTHRTLSPDELFDLAEGGLVEVGAHTVTHPVLSVLSAAMQRSEIQGSKARLEEILGRPVTSFAYPYGWRADYTAETVALVREAGFACACSNLHDVVWRRTDRFQLPRVCVRDWDGAAFARRLESWSRG